MSECGMKKRDDDDDEVEKSEPAVSVYGRVYISYHIIPFFYDDQ